MINAIDLANKTVEKVRTPAIPYVLGGRSPAGTDCINLVGWCVEELGGKKADVPRGSNTAWRTIMQGTWTLREAQRLGKLVPGALVYICDSPTPQWPDGDYGHVGVYVGKQKGWAADQVIVHASASRGGVYQSTIKNAWTHVAWMKIIDYENGESGSASGVSAMSARVVKKGGSKGVNLLRVATSGGALNIRQSANEKGAKVGSAPNGVLLEVSEDGDGWTRVKFGGVEGWACAQYLTPYEEPNEAG